MFLPILMKGIFIDGFINIILVSGITQLKTSGIALDYNILYGPLSEKEEQITEDLNFYCLMNK